VFVPGVEFLGIDQVQDPHAEVSEDLVGHVNREQTLPLQYVVEMGLADPGLPRESALGGLTALYATAQVVEKALLEVEKGHFVAA
jgi:hypothetical protein